MICLILRSQHLCFAVARIFARCVRARTARESSRRRLDTLSSSLSCREAAGTWRFVWVFPGGLLSRFCVLYIKRPQGRMKRYNSACQKGFFDKLSAVFQNLKSPEKLVIANERHP